MKHVFFIFSKVGYAYTDDMCMYFLSCVAIVVFFQRAFTACSCVFKEITFIGSNQGNYIEYATACNKCTLKTNVATQLLNRINMRCNPSKKITTGMHIHFRRGFGSIAKTPVIFANCIQFSPSKNIDCT